MDREVALRRSAQARLADALESSHEGVVVVDAEDRIALANAQAAGFPGVSPRAAQAGHAARRICSRRCADPVVAGCMLMRPNGEPPATGDGSSPTGAGCASASSATRDGGFIVVCSDITPVERRRRRRLRQTQLAARRRARQHVARPVPVRRARTGSRSSIAASSRSSACRATRSRPASTSARSSN